MTPVASVGCARVARAALVAARARLAAVMLVMLVMLAPRSAQAQLAKADEYRNVIEANAAVGYGRMLAPVPDETRETSAMNGGLSLRLGATYRTRYFVAPFMELGYTQLYASETRVRLSPAAELATADSSLVTWSVGAGLALDVWKLRFRGGVGVYDLVVRSKVRSSLGEARMMSTEIDMGYIVGVGATLFERERLRVGLEVRTGILVDAETQFVSFGITVSFDALRWGLPPLQPM